MSLTKLFNKNYFVQNILKSKAVIAVMIGIIPILNAIYLMALSSGLNDVMVANINLISILNIAGMYILPIVLSLCLFGYVFKKKSVDFINSMPLTRKTIFVTNSIGGILLIIIMMLVNVVLLFIESLLLTNLVIPFAMILDYFVVWTIAYIFVFTVANIATSISGNPVTMLIVTTIILFLVPFVHNYMTGFNGSLFWKSYYNQPQVIVEEIKTNDSLVKEDPDIYINIDRIEDEVNYTLPYNYFASIFKGEVKTYSTESIVKMLILSIIYFIIGIYLFEKRKMEVTETSFRSNNAHMLVKSLTLIPIGAFTLIIMNETYSFTINMFIFVLVIAYCFIYDLITTKTIRNFKLGIVYFIVTAVLSVGLYYGADYINGKVEEKRAFKVDEIEQVAFYIDDIEYTTNYSKAKMFNIYLDDAELVKLVKDILIEEQEYKSHYLKIRVKLENNEEYETRAYVDDIQYNKILGIVLNDERYEAEYKNIDYSKVMAVSIDNDLILTGEDMHNFLAKIKEAVDNVNLSYVSTLPYVEKIKLELYQNHDNIEYYIPLNISEDLLREYIDICNSKAINIKKDYFRIYNARIYNQNNYDESFYEYIYEDEVRKYISDYINSNGVPNVDVTKPLLVIYASVETENYEYEHIKYFTNNVVELMEEVNNIRGGLDE